MRAKTNPHSAAAAGCLKKVAAAIDVREKAARLTSQWHRPLKSARSRPKLPLPR